MSSIREDFVKFINQGNLVQLAIAFVIGAAFAAVVEDLVADLITPLIGIFFHVNFSSWTYTVNGSTFMQGVFVNALLSFIIVAVVVFFLIALPYQRYKDRKAAQAAATTRACPQCASTIPIAATRCAFCTQPVPPAPPPAPAPAATPAKTA